MNEPFLQERERALENAFFARQDAVLLDRLREEDRRRSLRQALATVSGIQDETVLDELALLGIGPQSLAALQLAPMVLVAWADGGIEPRERAAIGEAAREVGLPAHPEAATLLDAWLAAPPGRELAEAWRHYVQALCARLSPDGRAALRRDTMTRARRTAEATHHFLGFGGQVSPAKREVLEILDRAFG